MCNIQNTAIKVQSPKSNFFSSLLSLSDSEHPKPELFYEFRPKRIMNEMVSEAKSLFALAFPIAMAALILYSRSIVSMFVLGRIGDLELAAGSLAIAFANITGYSVLSGLSLGMEPLCSQAFGANCHQLLCVTLQRGVLFLVVCSVPISIFWIHMSKILLLLSQDPSITALAHTYLLFSLPDLLTHSFLHPIRIYLRAQGINNPSTIATLVGTLLHLPFNLLFVYHLDLGISGVAISSVLSNFMVLVSLILYFWFLHLHGPTWSKPNWHCPTGWKPLIRLAAPSCLSVCLEWWWYEIMIVLCGLLANPKATVASMGVLIQTTSLIYVFPSSLSFAVSTRVGNELGGSNPGRARMSAVVGVLAAATIGVSAVMFVTVMRYKWGRMFTKDDEILRLTSLALPVLGLCELGNCPQTVGCGVLRGTARPSKAANVNLGAFYLVGMPVAVGLAFWFHVGFIGLWIGLLAAQVCCAGLMLYVVGSTDWDLQAKRARALTSNGSGGNNNHNHCSEINSGLLGEDAKQAFSQA